MNKYYTKLKSISPESYKDFKLLDTQYVCAGSLSTYSYTDLDSSILLPKEIQNHFFMTHMAIRGKIIPHKDQGIQCKILIYLSDNHAITRFYKSFDPTDYKKVADNCNGCNFEMFSSGQCACSLKSDNLILVGQFEAKPNDVYLINTTELHSVEELSDENPRLALTWCTNISYNETYDMLKTYGLLNV